MSMKIECPNSLKVDKIRAGIMFFQEEGKCFDVFE